MSTDTTERAARDFRTTRWTLVARAKGESPEGRRALSELCQAYYEPVAAFLRFELRDREAARELAHDFFAHLLAGGALTHAAQARGRFRSYLLGAVKHFWQHQRDARRRLKRGGSLDIASLDDTEFAQNQRIPDPRVLSPDAAFDRQWALTAVARALDALRRECAEADNAEFFEVAKPWLTGDAERGSQAASAADCGMTPNALKVAVHRLKRRYRQLLKAEVTGTLDDPALVAEEMRALFAALGG